MEQRTTRSIGRSHAEEESGTEMFFSRKTRLLSLFSSSGIGQFYPKPLSGNGEMLVGGMAGLFSNISEGSDINLLLDLFNNYIIVVDAEESFRGTN